MLVGSLKLHNNQLIANLINFKHLFRLLLTQLFCGRKQKNQTNEIL